MKQDMTEQQWYEMVFWIAKNHPEWVRTTFEAFGQGVKHQAEINSAKVANMGAALSGLYSHPTSLKYKELARKRMLESGLFEGTEFGKGLQEPGGIECLKS